MSVILEKICVNTYTVVDLHRQLGLLQECLEEVLYHKNENVVGSDIGTAAVLYAQTVGSVDDTNAIAKWGSEVWKAFSATNLVEQIAQLKKETETIPTLTLYVPVAFDTPSVALVGAWVRNTVNKNILLEILVDSNVVGGCGFVFNDIYHDFSLHTALKKQKGIVTQLLTSYV